jgi:hypothetical protein
MFLNMRNKLTADNTQLAENAARKIVHIFEECGVRHFPKRFGTGRHALKRYQQLLANSIIPAVEQTINSNEQNLIK